MNMSDGFSISATSLAAPSSVRYRDRAAVQGKPSAIDALTLDAQYRQSLAAMRALTRMGLRVGALACQSDATGAPTFASRDCRVQAIVPDFATDPTAYVDGVLATLGEYPVQMILPMHDGAIEALRSRRAEIERRTALPLASEPALDIAVNKERTLALARDLGLLTPRSVHVATAEEARAAARELGLPIVIKPLESWVERDGVGWRMGVALARTEDEAATETQHLMDLGGQALAQEYLPGSRDAVTLFYAHGRVWARFVQTSYREFPVLGGVSTLCEGITPLTDLVEPAERLIQAIGLEGVSMVEFRRNREGAPVLMEINPRLPGSLDLAIHSGVNFPELLYRWTQGLPLQANEGYHVGKRLRWLAGDIWHLKQVAKHPGMPDTPPLRQALTDFVADFFLRPSALDFVDLRDMRPALVEFRASIIKPLLDKLQTSQH